MKKIFKLVFINVVILMILVIIADAAIGYFLHVPPLKTGVRTIRLPENLPDVDVEVKVEKQHLIWMENFTTKKSRFRTNSDGFVIGPNQQNKPVDIIFFGGSTTECKYIERRPGSLI